MRGTRLALHFVTAIVAGSCTSSQPSQAPSPQPSAQVPTQPPPPPSAGPADQRPSNVPGPAGPGGQGPRRAPNPVVQDSVRRMQVDSIMRTIAGRENEPAGTVFKNVKLLKSMPAGEFLKSMDVIYGRGLGMGCGNCHVLGKFDDDTRKNKRVAREMQEMTDYINSVRLASIKELDEDHVKVTCVTCHAGSNSPKATMEVPRPLAPSNR